MRVRLSQRAQKDQGHLPADVRKRLDRQRAYLISDLRHPLIRAKTHDESRDAWQGRVTERRHTMPNHPPDTRTADRIALSRPLIRLDRAPLNTSPQYSAGSPLFTLSVRNVSYSSPM